MVARPGHGPAGVVHGGRVRVLRGQPVVDRQDAEAAPVGERAAQVVVRVEVTEDPAAAVEPHEQAAAARPVRAVEAGADAVGLEVADLGDRFRARAQQGGPLGPRIGWRQLVDRRQPEGGDAGEQLGRLAMQRHAATLASIGSSLVVRTSNSAPPASSTTAATTDGTRNVPVWSASQPPTAGPMT